jgi:hypothetical protein
MPTRIILAVDLAIVRQGINSIIEPEGLQVVVEAYTIVVTYMHH